MFIKLLKNCKSFHRGIQQPIRLMIIVIGAPVDVYSVSVVVSGSMRIVHNNNYAEANGFLNSE